MFAIEERFEDRYRSDINYEESHLGSKSVVDRWVKVTRKFHRFKFHDLEEEKLSQSHIYLVRKYEIRSSSFSRYNVQSVID